jgi:protein MpaA
MIMCCALAVCGFAAAAAAPAVPRTVLLGRSVDGRPIKAIELGDPASPRKILVVGCIHGDETAGIPVAYALARGAAPAGVDLWIVPDLNPDGVAAGTRGNASGIDLNRNFSWRWRRLSGIYNSGPHALSEPESRIAHQLIERLRPAISIWFHQHRDVVDDSTGNRVIERRFGRVAGLRLAALAREPGGVVDWENHAFPGSSPFVVELPAGSPSPAAVRSYVEAVRAVAAPRALTTTSVRVHTFVFVDRSRTIPLPGGLHEARRLVTIVRTPPGSGSHPLIVFAHGFALTPATYRQLLAAWAAAGYVVAAPVFPRTSAGAPGGPTETDLVNQPRDVSVVITRLLAMSRSSNGVLAGLIDPSRIAVAGQSDGGITALAVAYDTRTRDRRVRAAIVLSGAPPAGMGAFPPGGPPLLAVQGTADPLNAPATTDAYFARAGRPKFLLRLIGASHLPPYTDQQPELGIVERTSIAFLARYVGRGSLAALERVARRPGVTQFIANP